MPLETIVRRRFKEYATPHGQIETIAVVHDGPCYLQRLSTFVRRGYHWDRLPEGLAARAFECAFIQVLDAASVSDVHFRWMRAEPSLVLLPAPCSRDVMPSWTETDPVPDAPGVFVHKGAVREPVRQRMYRDSDDANVWLPPVSVELVETFDEGTITIPLRRRFKRGVVVLVSLDDLEPFVTTHANLRVQGTVYLDPCEATP